MYVFEDLSWVEGFIHLCHLCWSLCEAGPIIILPFKGKKAEVWLSLIICSVKII
jgi:hypothetical protein